MSWLYLAIISHFIFAIVFVLDKIIVKKLLSPINYALIIGGLEGLAVLLIPFIDFSVPDTMTIVASFLSGIFFILGIYFYFKVLLKYEASWVVPFLFGVIVPIVTYILGRIFLGEGLTFFQFLAFVLLVIGGFILSFGRRYDLKSIAFLTIAGIFISLELVFLKIAFEHTNFLSGYVLSRIGGFIAAAVIVGIIYIRRDGKNISAKGFGLKEFIANPASKLAVFKQIISFVGNFLLIYAVSIGNLTLVNGLGGMRYAFVFLIAIFLARKWPEMMDEPLGIKTIIKKSIAILFIIVGVLVILLQPVKTPGVKTWGVDFTALYSNELELDAKEVLDSALDDLGVRDFRLAAHWSVIEKERGVYDFSSVDWQVEKVKKYDGKIVMAVGERLPRWPECHIPGWAQEIPEPIIQFEGVQPHYVTAEEFQSALLKYIEATVNHYKDNPAIWAWQLENEPFLFGFGECPYVDDELLDKEFALIKSLDDRPIVITDSGEFGLWFRAYKRADVFGTTMYRVVLGKWWPFGYFEYPLDPGFFQFKARFMEIFWGEKPIVNIELQAEPWLEKRPPFVPLEEQLKAFSLEQFKENIEYAKEVGFEKNYLWGVEWWYWMKTKQNYPEYWEEARKLFGD